MPHRSTAATCAAWMPRIVCWLAASAADDLARLSHPDINRRDHSRRCTCYIYSASRDNRSRLQWPPLRCDKMIRIKVHIITIIIQLFAVKKLKIIVLFHCMVTHTRGTHEEKYTLEYFSFLLQLIKIVNFCILYKSFIKM